MFLPVTLWLTPGNSQLGKMLPCISNRYSTGMCPGRPEHPCLPNRRVSLPPALPQHGGKLEPICPQTCLLHRLCVRGSGLWPCPGSLAQEALQPDQVAAAAPILPGSQTEEGSNTAQLTPGSLRPQQLWAKQPRPGGTPGSPVQPSYPSGSNWRGGG